MLCSFQKQGESSTPGARIPVPRDGPGDPAIDRTSRPPNRREGLVGACAGSIRMVQCRTIHPSRGSPSRFYRRRPGRLGCRCSPSGQTIHMYRKVRRSVVAGMWSHERNSADRDRTPPARTRPRHISLEVSYRADRQAIVLHLLDPSGGRRNLLLPDRE